MGVEPWYCGLLTYGWCQTIHEKFEAQRDEMTCPRSHGLIHDIFYFPFSLILH